MIYRSNLTCPDLTPHFKHLHSRPMPHSFGHDVPSDWADKPADDPVFGLYKNCGMLTHDEAAILYNVARAVPGVWLDIGAHTGWSSLHIGAATGQLAYPIEPMHAVYQFRERFQENMGQLPDQWCGCDNTSLEYFKEKAGAGVFADGFLIDGDHEPGKPMEDAVNAVTHLSDKGVIVFHDFMGLPVREAVQCLIEQHSMECKVYLTPHGMAVCWWGDWFKPPYHIPDPNIVAQELPGRWPEYYWKRYI